MPHCLYSNTTSGRYLIEAAWRDIGAGLAGIDQFKVGAKLFKDKLGANYYHIKETNPMLVSYTWCLEFNTAEDLTAFMLRYGADAEEMRKKYSSGDTAAFYAPYVPLAIANAICSVQPMTMPSSLIGHLKARYGKVAESDKKDFEE